MVAEPNVEPDLTCSGQRGHRERAIITRADSKDNDDGERGGWPMVHGVAPRSLFRPILRARNHPLALALGHQRLT